MNLFKRLQRLLPSPPLRVGTVVAVGDGEATVEELAGGRVRVRGTASIGSRVYFRDGRIESAAPSLPLVAVEE